MFLAACLSLNPIPGLIPESYSGKKFTASPWLRSGSFAALLLLSNVFAQSPRAVYRINRNRKGSLVVLCEDARDLKGSLPFLSHSTQAAVFTGHHCSCVRNLSPSLFFRYVSAMTTPARMSPVDFHTPTSPKSRPSTVSPPASSLTVSIPSVAVSPFIEEERPLLLVTPLQLHEKYDHHLQQFNSFHHNATHESNSLPPSPLRIVEDEEYETTQEYEPAQEPPKKLTNSRRVKRTKPNGHISSRVEVDSDTSSESSSSETETEDERIGEDTPFLSIPTAGAASLEPATAFRLAETRTNPANRFSTPEELQARLSSVIANQDPIAV